MKKNILRIIFMLLIISMNIGCDQSTKFLAKKYLKNISSVQVIDNYFILLYAENKGAFLSIFSNLSEPHSVFVLIVFPLIVLFLISLYLIQNNNLSPLYVFSLCCIIGGGISNVMIDRLFNINHYVVDFMNIGIGSIRSGIFNFADLSIMIGVFIILFLSFTQRKTNNNINT